MCCKRGKFWSFTGRDGDFPTWRMGSQDVVSKWLTAMGDRWKVP